MHAIYRCLLFLSHSSAGFDATDGGGGGGSSYGGGCDPGTFYTLPGTKKKEESRL